MGTLKVGVVGVGKMGEYHVGILSEIMGAEVVAVVDVSEDRGRDIAKRYETSYLSSNRDILGKVDAVVVAVPTSLHYQVAKEFLTAGIHVLLEKPCANNLDHARELFDIASEKNLILHIGHVERFNGAVQELYKIVSDPIYVECKRMGAFSERVRDDGVILDIMIHDIDIVLNLVQSRVAKINVLGASVFSERDDFVSAQLEFENGCIANIVASRASQNKERTLSLTQKDEYVLLDYTEQEIYVHRQSSSESRLSKGSLRYKQESLIERIFVHKDNPLKLELLHFIDCVKNGSPRNVAVDNELYSLEIALNILAQFNNQRKK
jgi:predicted dehydrogenase